MKYICLGYYDKEKFDGMTDSERNAMFDRCFEYDDHLRANQSGQQAAEQLAHHLAAHGISTRRVLLPEGHDPNSFFVGGGDARQFQSLMEAAEP